MIKLKDILAITNCQVSIMDDLDRETILNITEDYIEYASLYLSESLLNSEVISIQNDTYNIQVFVKTEEKKND